MNWTCPFCQRDQVVIDEQRDVDINSLNLKFSKYKSCGYIVSAIACSNKDCGEVTLQVGFGPGQYKQVYGNTRYQVDLPTQELFQLRPKSRAKPQPEAVPRVLAEDYYEACAIRDLSPKASATLSRRVLQGMIRDFCKIARRTLFDEIEALKSMADEGRAPSGVAFETIDAMHSVRSIGNIGAHMEMDIDVIVDVDPEEAQALIELIEMLFDEWYVEQKKREMKLANIKTIADSKKDMKEPSPK